MNIGFSQKKQLNNNKKRRLEMVTRTNQTKSRLTVIKPRNKALFVGAVLETPEIKNIKTAPIKLREEIIPEQENKQESKQEIIIEKRLPEPLTRRFIETEAETKTNIKTIQIGLLNLSEINRFGKLCQNYKLPSWQFTAFDPPTGGVWISYASAVDAEKQNSFIAALSRHLISCGLSPEQIKFELCYDSTIQNKLGPDVTDSTAAGAKQCFDGRMVVKTDFAEQNYKINKLHNLFEDKFYQSVKVHSVPQLLKKVESFLVQYNYNENYEASLSLPANQLMCRQYGNKSGPNILRFKPLVLEMNQTGKIRYLLGLKMMAGLFSSMAGSVRSGSKRIRNVKIIKRANRATIENKVMTSKTKISKPLMSDRNIKPTAPIVTVKPVENKFEFISLKNMNWEKPAVKQFKSDSESSRVRNRRELINRAKYLLAQKRSIAELKKTLPMTEGELSMLSQNITLSDRERIIQ